MSFHPRILIEKPYVASLTIDEDQKTAHVRLDNEANLPFWFEFTYDLRTNSVLGSNGRTGALRATVDVEAERRPDGLKFSCHDNVNDWHVEFTMLGI